MTPNIADYPSRVSLEVRCIDRVYLHAYTPKLQTSGCATFSTIRVVRDQLDAEIQTLHEEAAIAA